MTKNEAIEELKTSIDLAKMCTQNSERKREIEAYNMAISALEETQVYRAIGTIDEFKALKEKSVAKKAKWHPNPCAEDNRIPICPNCNTIMVRTEIFGRTIDEHCVSCGQAIDWSE